MRGFSRGGGTSKSARGRKSESPGACRAQGSVFHGFWAPFGVPGEALLETFSQLFAQRRSWGAIGRDSESDFSGNDFFLGFGASFSQIRGLREVLDVHLDWAGAVQTHFGLFAKRCVTSREKSPQKLHLGVLFEGFGAHFGTGDQLFDKRGSRRALLCTVAFPSRFSWILGSGRGGQKGVCGIGGDPLGPED